jgi:hypothetical protein
MLCAVKIPNIQALQWQTHIMKKTIFDPYTVLDSEKNDLSQKVT